MPILRVENAVFLRMQSLTRKELSFNKIFKSLKCLVEVLQPMNFNVKSQKHAS